MTKDQEAIVALTARVRELEAERDDWKFKRDSLKEEADRDYFAMREFQSKFIAADQELRALRLVAADSGGAVERTRALADRFDDWSVSAGMGGSPDACAAYEHAAQELRAALASPTPAAERCDCKSLDCTKQHWWENEPRKPPAADAEGALVDLLDYFDRTVVTELFRKEEMADYVHGEGHRETPAGKAFREAGEFLQAEVNLARGRLASPTPSPSPDRLAASEAFQRLPPEVQKATLAWAHKQAPPAGQSREALCDPETAKAHARLVAQAQCGAPRAPDGELCRCPLGGGWNHDHDGERIIYRETPEPRHLIQPAASTRMHDEPVATGRRCSACHAVGPCEHRPASSWPKAEER